MHRPATVLCGVRAFSTSSPRADVPKDPYGTLGVGKDASAKDIKNAYYQLAKKYHPDANKEPGAKERFVEIQAAYDLLSDADKRAAFDKYGTTDGSNPGFNPFGGGSPFGGGGSPFGGFHAAGSAESIFESLFGGAFGGGAFGGGAFGGGLNIPAGVDDGYRIRMDGAGDAPLMGEGQTGSLVVRINVAPSRIWRRQGTNLFYPAHIPFYTAVLGGRVRVPTLQGDVEVRVPSGTQPGEEMVLRGRGVPRLSNRKNYDSNGDLMVQFDITIPRQSKTKSQEGPSVDPKGSEQKSSADEKKSNARTIWDGDLGPKHGKDTENKPHSKEESKSDKPVSKDADSEKSKDEKTGAS
ncbi:mdj1 protein precursor [Malassezia obtusa]|uniref:DnaJ homolog 1, mitochondrial n=1 Tax=Malassezia obtusa TaxID=76774 RepID=A0AAF0DXM9_9BASI|nr:mdj1 protein precursor [Malassezia obtusa]